jgi:hypothetical protein
MSEKDFVTGWLLAMRTNFHPFEIEGDITNAIKVARHAYKLIDDEFLHNTGPVDNPFAFMDPNPPTEHPPGI